MLCRFIISIFIISTGVITQSSDDESTAEWLLNYAPKKANEDDLNLDPTGFTKNTTNNTRRPEAIDEDNDLNLDPSPTILESLFRPPSPGVPLTADSKNVNTKRQDAPNAPNTSSDDEINLNPSPSRANQECTINNETGVCVRYYQCEYGRIIEDGSTLIDVRARSCAHYLEVCCLPSKINTTILDTSKSVDIATDKGGSNKCGWNNPALHIFQPNGKEREEASLYANYGDFPWMIALMRKQNDSNEYLGGGSLIHTRVVITAAHKVDQYGAQEIKCRAGEWDTQTTFEIYPHQDRDVMKIIIHPDYYKTSALNNVALLFLRSPYDMSSSPNINVACVGSSLPAPGTACYSMGWGKDFKKNNKYAVILKKVRLPLVGAEECQSLLRETRLGPFFKLHQSLTCAGGEEGLDTCRGDGGAPLVCPIQTLGPSTRYAVFGMVAYGIGCYNKNSPSVYVNVPHLKSWLDSTMAAEGYTTEQYSYKLE